MHRARRRAASLATVLGALAIAGACGSDVGEPSAPTTVGTVATTAAPPSPTTNAGPDWAARPDRPRYRPTPPVLAAPDPVRLDVDAIAVHTALVPLGRNPDGTMQVPVTASVAGWYAFGPRPGEDGPAVIAGHVDSSTGPGVFLGLRDLGPGDRIVVTRADASRATFVVTHVVTVEKVRFPTALVFGASADPELRLITCDGAFDRRAGHYVSNRIVFARLVSVRT